MNIGHLVKRVTHAFDSQAVITTSDIPIQERYIITSIRVDTIGIGYETMIYTVGSRLRKSEKGSETHLVPANSGLVLVALHNIPSYTIS